MVGHYADVARLVGLTENELYTQLKNIKQHANLSKFLVKKLAESITRFLDNEDLSSPYAQSFHLGLLKSIEEDRRRKPPVKPVSPTKTQFGLPSPTLIKKFQFGLGGPKAKRTKLPPINNNDKRVTLKVVGLDRMSHVVQPPGRKTFKLNPVVINSELAKKSQVSQLRERRKSLGLVLANHDVRLYLLRTYYVIVMT